MVEYGPVRDRVARELMRSMNDAGVALGTPAGSENEVGILRSALQRLKQRSRMLAARLGCRSTDAVDPQPRLTRTQAGETSQQRAEEEGEEEHEEGEEGDGQSEEEEQPEEIGSSQLAGAPQPSQPSQGRPQRKRVPVDRYTPSTSGRRGRH